MKKNSFTDQLRTWKAEHFSSEEPQKKRKRETGKSEHQRKVSKKRIKKKPDPTAELKNEIRTQWSNGYTAKAIIALAELGRRRGRFNARGSKANELKKGLRKLSEEGRVEFDDQILALAALDDEKSLIKLTARLINEFAGSHNIQTPDLAGIKQDDFLKFVLKEVNDRQARKEVVKYFSSAISMAEQDVALNRVGEFLRVAREIFQIDGNVEILTPIPTPEDLSLAAKWTGDPRLLSEDFDRWLALKEDGVPENLRKDWELGRCLSARLAEKAAANVYRNLNLSVRDIARTQLNEGGDDLWKLCDLEVGGQKIDVKNARRSRTSPDTYVEHCVPRFKTDRESDDIMIAGVLSDYQWVDYLVHPEKARNLATSVFLGETSRQTLNELSDYFCRDGVLEMDFSRKSQPYNFLPAWVFSYSEEFYKSSSKAVAKLNRMTLPSAFDFQKAKTSITMPLVINNHPSKQAYGVNENPLITRFLDELSDVLTKFPKKLPAVFMCVLTDFLKTCLDEDRQLEFSPDIYLDALFFERKWQFPAGIYDPLFTLQSLINTLSVLWERNRNAITKYRQFKLRGGTILQGRPREGGGRWETLVAHCGGLFPDYGKCGKYPLVAGLNETCSSCGYLICDNPECDFCYRSCERYQRSKNVSGMPL